MKLKTRILVMKLAKQILVPFDAKVGMQSTLHQYAGTTESDGLIDFDANLVQGSNVSIGCTGSAVEGTERTNNVADVGVIDIAIDDVGNNIGRMFSLADLVSGRADAGDIMRFQ